MSCRLLLSARWSFPKLSFKEPNSKSLQSGNKKSVGKSNGLVCLVVSLLNLDLVVRLLNLDLVVSLLNLDLVVSLLNIDLVESLLNLDLVESLLNLDLVVSL